MAGFAVFMTILTYVFFGVMGAVTASILLHFAAKRRVQGVSDGSRDLVLVSTVAPFVGLLWIVAALLIHVLISNELAHQDCGLSGDPYVTLPNGYTLGSHNTYDGYFAAPDYETDVPVSGPGYVRSIIDLQWTDSYFIGTQFDLKTSKVRHFVFDTRDRALHYTDPAGPMDEETQLTEATKLDRWAAAETSAHDDATSYWTLYAKYRHHWPNYVLIALILLGELALGLWVWRLWAAMGSNCRALASDVAPGPCSIARTLSFPYHE